jgi:tetratricopeptide (TPR) repeat protein
MFTALFVTRIVLNAFYALGIRDEKYYGTVKERKSINFLSRKGMFFAISLACIIAGFVFMGVNKANIGDVLNYSLEFKGGTSTNVTFNENLSLEEILYSSILTDDIKKQEEIFNTAIKLHPNDYRAYNNLGVMAYNQGDYNTAKSYFAKAGNADNAALEVKINNGYIELMQGNVADAESYITVGAHAKAGNEALGNLYIAQGMYGRAAALLDTSNTNSAALAQLLNKDYSTARQTLESIENPDATTGYIKAILGARTSNIAFVYDGLKEAIKLDPSLAQKAANDLEFRKYTKDETFMSIIK